MLVRIGRILGLAILAEAIAILALVLLVAVAGPSEPEAARAWAEQVGYWFGPAAGFVLCIAGGWLAARPLPSHHLVNGLIFGAVVAAIDVALLVASGAEFQMIFVVSNIGRVVAGSIGGWLASRDTRAKA